MTMQMKDLSPAVIKYMVCQPKIVPKILSERSSWEQGDVTAARGLWSKDDATLALMARDMKYSIKGQSCVGQTKANDEAFYHSKFL